MRRYGDATLALAIVAFGLLDRALAPNSEGPVIANVVCAVGMGLPFAWRRTHPYLMVIAIGGAGTLNQLVATPVQEIFSALVIVITAGYVLARHHEGRRRTGVLALAAVLLGIGELFAESPAIPFVWLLLFGGAIGGALVRSRAALTRELAERTHELDALRELHERDAVLDERRRIARELHDVIAHTVSVMVVQAGGARRQLGRDPERALAALDQVDATGREALAELDRLFGLLHEPLAATGLDDLGVLVERTRTAGLPVELQVTGEAVPLEAEAGLAAYRVVQEALTNTLKHGGPGATATVDIRWQDGRVEIAVTDTGWGESGPSGEGSRRGLHGMRDRVAALGGEVEAGPRPAGGFEVRARLPVGAREEVPA